MEATTAINLPVDAVTIYPDGLVFVKRIGTMDLTEGEHNFVVDVPTAANMDTILFLVTNSSLKRIVYQGLPVYTINSTDSGRQEFMLSYLMEDAGSWEPRYALHLGNDSLIVSARALVKGDMGQDLKNVRLKLVAGPRPDVWRNFAMLAAAPMEMAEEEPRAKAAYMPSTGGLGTGQLETLFIFELENRTDLEMGKTIGLPLFEMEAPMKRLYTWDAYYQNEGPVTQEIRANNTGSLPWPGGQAMVYKEGDYVTRADLSYTPTGANATLEIGPSSELKVSKKQTGYNITQEIRTIKDDNTTHHFQVTRENYSYKLTAKSNADRSLFLEVEDQKPMKAELTAVSPAPTETTATTMKWELEVKPREELSITYTYRLEEMEPVEK